MSRARALEQQDPVGVAASAEAPAPGAELRRIELRRIKAYAHNPRRGINPEYDRLKASIRVQGIDQPLVVTQRPGEDDYTIAAGGNTRLRILKELLAEVAGAAAKTVTCVVKPWVSEADVIVAHLRENDLRGDLTFIDKAVAVLEMRRLLSGEDAPEAVTQDALTSFLRDHGYHVSQSHVSLMTYAVERLLPLIPLALDGGLGRRSVERIRLLERGTRTIWRDQAIDTDSELECVFETLCKRYDSPDWDLELVRRALEGEMAARAEVNVHTVSMAIDQVLSGRAPENGPHWVEEAWPPEEALGEEIGGAAEQHAQGANEEAPDNAESDVDEVTTAVAGDTPSGLGANSHDVPDDSVHAASVLGQGFPTTLTDLKSLRARAWTLATRLAQRNGLGDLIAPLPGQGLGFLLCDVPDPALVEQLDEDALAKVSMVWWHLAACAEMTVAPVEHIVAALSSESVLKQALESQDAGLLFSSVWTLDPGHTGYRLWRQLDDRDWSDLLGLMDTYRAIYRVVGSTGEFLWR